ncbi:MAG: hypothetical protein WCJ01_08240 [Ignavibacteria bacterium]
MRKEYLYPIAVILINVIIYLFVIALYPGFIFDDFIIFGRIAQSPYNFFSYNPHEIFFLFLRPVSYLSFNLDYLIWGNNAFAMKVETLILHCIYILVFFKLLIELCGFFRLKANYLLISIICLLLSLSQDSLIWVYWISNRTELLGTLFYALGVYAVVKFVNTNENKYLPMYLVFYFLSVLSKQQGLHLPLLILFLSYSLSVKEVQKKRLAGYSLAGILILIIYSVINYVIFGSTLDVSAQIWKKPFAVIGSILFAFIPDVSRDIYNYFLINKVAAFILMAAVMAVIFYFLVKKYLRGKSVINTIVFIAIIFYPRMFAGGSPRLNGIILFWGLIACFLIINMSKYKEKLVYVTLSVAVMFYSYSFIKTAHKDQEMLVCYDKEMKELITQIIPGRKNLVVASEHIVILNYKMFYYKNQRFGYDSSFYISPFFYDRSMQYEVNTFRNAVVSCSNRNNFISLKSEMPFITVSVNELGYDMPLLKKDDFRILNKAGSKTGRQYDEIIFEIPEVCVKEKYNLLYNNGKEWKNIKL